MPDVVWELCLTWSGNFAMTACSNCMAPSMVVIFNACEILFLPVKRAVLRFSKNRVPKVSEDVYQILIKW